MMGLKIPHLSRLIRLSHLPLSATCQTNPIAGSVPLSHCPTTKEPPKRTSTGLWETPPKAHCTTASETKCLLVTLFSFLEPQSPPATSFPLRNTYLRLLAPSALRDQLLALADISKTLELPHRTTLQVLPLPEEESRRPGPVNHPSDTFRPP